VMDITAPAHNLFHFCVLRLCCAMFCLVLVASQHYLSSLMHDNNVCIASSKCLACAGILQTSPGESGEWITWWSRRESTSPVTRYFAYLQVLRRFSRDTDVSCHFVEICLIIGCVVVLIVLQTVTFLSACKLYSIYQCNVFEQCDLEHP
jgi:hypothetical protein